ncbi:MAG: glycosyltransferase family 2 protein [Pseudomonadota bacterium]
MPYVSNPKLNMNNLPKISAIIITKNEENNIDDCLASIAWCNEIVIIDSGSTDNTIELCRKYTDKIIVTDDWPGFGLQKNRALEIATNEWVLSIDADERVSAKLAQEIKQTITNCKEFAFRIPRESSYCGRFIKHSGWSPDYVIRLFKRDSAHFSDDIVHEKVEVLKGDIGTFKSPLRHYPFNSIEEVLDKINSYSTSNALKHYRSGKKSSLSKAIFHGAWAFFRAYILRAGFLDGQEGFILAISSAEVSYYRYIKLMYLQRKHVKH